MKSIKKAISWRTQQQRHDEPLQRCKAGRQHVTFGGDDDDEYGIAAYNRSAISIRNASLRQTFPLDFDDDDDTVTSALTFDLPAAQRKKWCRSYCWIIPAVLIVILLVTLVVLLCTHEVISIGGDNTIPSPTFSCDSSIASSDPFEQCQCHGEINLISDEVRSMYESLKSSALSRHLEKNLDISSCHPDNVALIWTSLDVVDYVENTALPMDRIVNRFVLALTYATMGGKGWITKSGWLSHQQTECSWYGIVCDENQTGIVSLNLAENGIHGYLESSLALLPVLQTLNLTDNSVSGMIPDDLWDISTLEEVLLGSNKLVGSLPERLSEHLPLLKRLALSNNDFFGPMPSLVGLTNLVELDLSDTIISGRFPSEGLEDLDNLSMLKLSHMPSLSGTLSSSIGSLTSLKEIHLQGTSMSGTIPESIGNLKSLVYFEIEGFNLRGSIPTTVGLMTNIEHLQLGNSLTGSIPTFLGQLTAMSTLRLGHNDLVGSLPTELAGCTQLQEIHVNQNPRMDGTFPPGFSELSNLERVDMSCTNITGPFSAGLCSRCTVVVTDDVQGDKYSDCTCCEEEVQECTDARAIAQ